MEKIELVNHKKRKCPFCGCANMEELGNIAVSVFCGSNFAYRPYGYKDLGYTGEELFPIVQCVSCKVGAFSLYELSNEVLNKVYDWLINESISRAFSLRNDRLARAERVCANFMEARKRLNLNSADVVCVLDYGAGWGDFSLTAKKLGFDVLAHEVSSSRVRHLRSLDINVCCSDELIVENNPYDFIYCNQVLEHVSDPSRLLRLFKKNLKQDGILFITVPMCNREDLLRLLSEQDVAKIPKEINPWEHMNYFYGECFDLYLKKHGFEKIEGCSSFYIVR